MPDKKLLKSTLLGSACAMAIASTALAENFNIPAGNLDEALSAYTAQTGVQLMVSDDAVRGVHTKGVVGSLSSDQALSRLLSGTGFVIHHQSGAILLIRTDQQSAIDTPQMVLAQATAPSRGAVETVTVTSSKLGGADVQSIPIAITALSQEQLTSTQTAGGPDLVKQVPNLTFSKTNFTGYNIQIRGIGTQAISVATDPAVAVAFNDIPFLRNHFFEQEFFDVSQVEVLRGPQGTLYGRNATAGVVNLTSARPTDQFEAMASVDVANYHGRRIEGMVNIPVVDDRLDLRVAGELTKRDGYSFNDVTQKPIDGRDLWSTRVTLGFKPIERLQTYLIWEHFTEGDDRLRSSKQLCERDPGPSSIGNVINLDPSAHGWLSQGCLPGSLYSPSSYQTVNGNALPFVVALQYQTSGYADGGGAIERTDPYASGAQSLNLRVIESALTPTYKASNDVVEFNADFTIAPELTLTSQTGYNHDRIASAEDFNRFTTAPGIFSSNTVEPPGLRQNPIVAPPTPYGEFCDPQLGCQDRLAAEDLSQARSWQVSQEFRLASKFSGPLNFNIGGNYLHYETLEDYYVFINLLTLVSQSLNQVGLEDPSQAVGDFTHCGQGNLIQHNYGDPTNAVGSCVYIDPNPLSSLTGNGHNYFRSTNPYTVNSYAGFGEVYYQVATDLKLTGGLRWTDDQKHFVDIPSWVAIPGWGYPITAAVDQEWKQFTGRFVATWTPKIDFTDQSLFYGSYSRGYKGGGANPPGPAVNAFSSASASIHPLTFAPEFNNAFELGTKNTLDDGTVTINGDVFYYDYKGYQISEIIDRTSINLNIDAKVKGAEFESTWEPIPGLRFNLSAGYETSRIDNGQSSIDLMDRTAGHTDWTVVHPWLTATSNCILPKSAVGAIISSWRARFGGDDANPISAPIGILGYDITPLEFACLSAYSRGLDPGAFTGAVTGFDPSTAPNGGAGFSKDLGGKELPNTPHLTLSWGAQYSVPVNSDWAATLRGDFYYQSESWARIFNDNPYDRLRGYTNLNLALILTSQNGWQAMGYMKNVFNTTAVTGAFLNSDDTGLTTNVFVTDPRLFGIRITKNW